MINVLHLRDTDKICGPGKTILETISAIDKQEFNLIIGLFLLNREKTNVYFEEAEKRGVPIVAIRTTHQYDPRVILKITKIIRDHNIHILHTHEYKSDLIGVVLAGILNIPVVTTLHGWIANSAKSRLYIGLQKKVLPYFDKVIAVSDKTKEDLIKASVPEKRIDVLYNAIVVEKYQPSAEYDNYLRNRFDLPKDAVLIGNIGRLSPEKGQRDFLLAAGKILQKHKNAHFILVGDGPDRNNLVNLSLGLGINENVHFTGHLNDVRPAFQDLDLMALTSHTEGFPNVILEAFCMGKPVLATDVGGVAEIIRDGETGVLIPSKSPERIADGLELLIAERDLGRTMAQKGRLMVLEKFQFKTRVQKEQDVYREMLKR